MPTTSPRRTRSANAHLNLPPRRRQRHQAAPEVYMETASYDEKAAILEEFQLQSDLIDVFKNVVPVQARSEQRDKRIYFGVNKLEKERFLKQVNDMVNRGKTVDIDEFIRNKVTASPPIHEWAARAQEAIVALQYTKQHKKPLTKKAIAIGEQLAEGGDQRTMARLQREYDQIKENLNLLVGKSQARGFEMDGYLTHKDAELVQYRAEQLFLSNAAYIRFMLFDWVPASPGDRYMSLDARLRFYVSVLEISKNGWKNDPRCTSCQAWEEKYRALEDRLYKVGSII